MAAIGTTKLDAVNQILRAIGLDPVAALDTNGTSDESEIEEILDRSDEELQAMGWEDNVELAKAHVPVGDNAGTTTMTDGSHTAATRNLNKTGAFASYTFASGDEIYIAGGTNVKEGYYGISSKTDNDNIVLDHQIAIGDQTDVEVAGIGNLIVTVNSATLWIRGAGPDKHRNLVLSGDSVYDADRGTTRLLSDDTVYLDVIVKRTFANLGQRLKNLIIAHAARIARQRKMPDALQDQFLAEHEGYLDRMADRVEFDRRRDVPPNPTVVFPLRPIGQSQSDD